MTGIEHNDNRTIAPRFTRLWTTLRRRHLLIQIALVVIFKQRQQRILYILGIGRIEIHHQSFFKARYRCQRKKLWLHILLQLKHHTHGLRVKLPDSCRLDVRIVRADLRPNTLKHRVQIDAFNIYHHTLRITQGKLFVFQQTIGFYRDAGIAGRWPYAHRNDLTHGSQTDLTDAQKPHSTRTFQ
ncbi:hypothetical protein D3C81_1578350 [compost metagenome]